MGRKKLYTEDELRIKRNERRMKQYWANREAELKKSKERYHNNKSADEVVQPTKPIKKVTVYNTPIEEIEEEVTFIPIEDESTGHYQSEII